MPYFYVNQNEQPDTGDNEVHLSDENACSHHADYHNRIDLGWHVSCHSAVEEAKSRGYNANGCYYCANACHTS